MQPTQQRGNILFLILLAIVLFVALSYAVMGQRDQAGAGMSSEQLDAKAAMIIQYTTLMEQTVTRLRVSGGCRDTELSFVSPAFTTSYVNNNAPPDKHCHVFDPAGGGMTLNTAVFDETSGTTAINGSADTINSASAVRFVGTDCADAACNELMIHLNLGSDANAAALCERINRKLSNGALVQWSGFQFDKPYRGDFYTAPTRILGDPVSSSPWMGGKPAGCYYDVTSTINGVDLGHNAYYHVLIAR